ncbi:MAG: cbb3-type cytochrome c oxidase subunit II, partial [Cytophagales bacterium]|nr:cbb3-type cytochrome c oxidase subunit II [Cytophagales bacterium]
GSKRTGPDLHREGGKYLDSWHYHHMNDPTTMSPGSIMPAYPWIIEQKLDLSQTAAKISALRTVGVPYPAGYEDQALAEIDTQAKGIAANLKKEGVSVESDREIIALIAYLQRLGTDIKNVAPTEMPIK